MSIPPWSAQPDPTGPPAGWPSSPPYQQPPSAQPAAGPHPPSGPYGPPHYRPTPPADPRWTGTKMFFVVWGILTGVGPIVGGIYGIGLAAIYGRQILEEFGTVDQSGAAVGFGVLFGAIAGALIGFFVGVSAGLASGGVAAGMWRKRSATEIATAAGLAALVVAAFIALSWTGAATPGDAGSALTVAVIPCLLVGGTGALVAGQAAVRAERADRQAAGSG